MEKFVLPIVEVPHHCRLSHYLFDEDFFGKILFKNLSHLAYCFLKQKGICGEYREVGKYRGIHNSMKVKLLQCLEKRPLKTKGNIAAFYNELFATVQMRQKEICPHGGNCTRCPLRTTCKDKFERRFKCIYPDFVRF